MKKYKIGGQFSGVGAFDQALIRLGVDYENVYQAEWDKFARQTYLCNYEEPEYYVKDVYDTPTQEITEKHGSLDIMMFSPPCQSFSLAGKRKGEEDERGILFYNSHEFIRKNKPRYFIFENVKGLISDNDGKTFNRWIDYLGGKSVNGSPVLFPSEKSVPYHIYYKVLNAKDYGVPQNRERVFIVGIRDDNDNNFSWPKEQFLERRLKDVLESEVDEKYYLSDKMIESFTLHKNRHIDRGTGFQWQPKTIEDVANCLRANAALCPTDNTIKVKSATSKGFEIDNVVVQIGVNDRIYGWHENENVIAGHRNDLKRSTVSEHVYHKKDGICITIQTAHVPKLADFRIRKLTPRECFRLMDFPDSFTWPVSDSQAYKQAGNSIVVNVLYNILKKLRLC